MTYYELLGIAEEASKIEIKKAYFGLVKQYPPEKYPEKFKDFRKAYEMLIDVNAREQYDRLNKVPRKYKELYDSALEAMEYGDYEFAIKILKEVVRENPELQILNSLLGDIYIENDNSGNAIKIFERLIILEPDNASYQGKLAEAYTLRGYTKKAISQFEKSLAMNPDNMNYWMGLTDAYCNVNNMEKSWQILKNGIARMKELGIGSLDLHVYALYICIKKSDIDNMQEHMNIIREEISNDNSLVEYVLERALCFFSKLKHGKDILEAYYLSICFFNEIAPGNEEIAMVKKEIHKIYILMQIDKDINVPDYFAAMMELLLKDCDCPTCRIQLCMLESEFLYDIDSTRKTLNYIRKTYPECYDINKKFYDHVMNPKKVRRLHEDSYKKMMSYQKKYPYEFQEMMQHMNDEMEFLDDSEIDNRMESDEDKAYPFPDSESYPEPFVRLEPKISRNDPCPCGSEKKYKKCCGK